MNSRYKSIALCASALVVAGSLFWAFARTKDVQSQSRVTSGPVDSGNTAPIVALPAGESMGSAGTSGTSTLSVGGSRQVFASASADASRREASKIFRAGQSARDILSAIRSSSMVTNADKLYFNALLGELCSNPALAKIRSTPAATTLPAAASDPGMTPQRQRAREQMNSKQLQFYCDGMPVLSQEAQLSAWLAAANAGDPQSIARLDWAAFEATFKPDPALVGNSQLAPDKTLAPVAWDAAKLNVLAQGLASRDPTAIFNIGMMLQQTAHSNFVALSGNGMSLADSPIATWSLVACYYGAQCGSENMTLLSACANEGRCDSVNMEDHYRRYVWTPEEAARYDTLLPYLRELIDKGDPLLLSILTFDPAKGPQNRYYGKPPRPYRPG